MTYLVDNVFVNKKLTNTLTFKIFILTTIGLFSLFQSLSATEPNFIYGDALPNAPELAKRGGYAVGVRTFKFTNPNQFDLVESKNLNQRQLYDRPLTVELWYPAKLNPNQQQINHYQDSLLSKKKFMISGRAARDARYDDTVTNSPLIILSHGFPGSRFIMAYLAENLASKGYVVASIDHTDSTHSEDYKDKFGSTLFNRAKDQSFTISEIQRLNKDKTSFLYHHVDVNNSAIIGYSMGGYGALISAGAGVSKGFVELTSQTKIVPEHQLSVLQLDSKEYKNRLDPRIKAIVLLAPWGGEASLKPFGVPKGLSAFDKSGLSGIKIPSMFIVGTDDQVAFYQEGVQSLFKDSINSDRYLLTFDHGQHNIATHPAPSEARIASDYKHYQEDVWAHKRLNNINQHFITAFLDKSLKKSKNAEYLELNPSNGQSNFKGFPKGSAIGLHLYHQPPAATMNKN